MPRGFEQLLTLTFSVCLQVSDVLERKRRVLGAMSVVKMPDAGGDTLRLLELEDFLFPPYHADIIRDLPQLPLGEDDVIVCGYPQSGGQPSCRAF